jgi:hypothetical protein
MHTRTSFILTSGFESQYYITTDDQSASLSWNKAPIWVLRPDLLMWIAFSDETTGLSFAVAAGTRQPSHFRVRLLWDSRSYFNVSDTRLPFSSPPTTRRDTVEVFEPTSTRDTSGSKSNSKSKLCYDRWSVCQSVLE